MYREKYWDCYRVKRRSDTLATEVAQDRHEGE